MSRPEFTTFYIVRHGETVWNTERRLQGHRDSPLTEKGVAQAHEVAQLLKDHGFAAAFSSDLFRAQRTAEIIAAEHDVTVKTSQLLREGYMGKYEGWTVEEYRKELKEAIEALEAKEDREQFSHSESEHIETDEAMSLRLVTFLREIALLYFGQKVLVVTHGGVMRALLIRLGWGTYNEIDHHAINNTAYIKLDCDSTEFFIRETHNIVKQ